MVSDYMMDVKRSIVICQP